MSRSDLNFVRVVCPISWDEDYLNALLHTKVMGLPLQKKCNGIIGYLSPDDWICRQCRASGPHTMSTDHEEEPDTWVDKSSKILSRFRRDGWFITIEDFPQLSPTRPYVMEGRKVFVNLKKYSPHGDNFVTYFAEGDDARLVLASCAVRACDYLEKEVPPFESNLK